MIGNNDIFDEEELQAIAADASSAEDSSCQHSLHSGDEPTNDFGGVKEKTANTKKQGNENDDSSTDDGGFLESWLEAEKKKSESDIHKHKDIQISQNNDEDITPKKAHEQVDETMKNTMQLGDSVLQWIESTKRKKRYDNDCGIVGIQRNDGEAFSETSTLKLSKPNTKKRSRAGIDQSEVLIEESSSGLKMCGEAVQSEEGMVDCIARYDKDKGCYVLEAVDLLINNLQTSTAEAVPNEEEAACDKDKADTDVDRQQFNPLTKAKRAEQQIKKLKKGKRTSSTKEMRREASKKISDK